MLKPRWKKLLADLWSNRARTVMVIASIAVGVFAIGVIAGTYVILEEDLALSYSESNPANITLRTLPFDQRLIDAVRRMDGVADAEGRAEVTVRVRSSGIAWDTLQLVAQPDYAESKINRRFVKDGATVPADRELILEHKTLAALDLAIGDVVTIELPDGTSRAIPIVGSAIDQADLEETMVGELRGYITLDTLEWLRVPVSMTKLLVTVAENPDDEAHIRQVSSAVTNRLESNGYPVFQSEVAGTHAHPFGHIIQALLWVLVFVGVLIAVLSSSLIANTMSALLAQQLRQIGVMKLVGARRFQVVGLYLVLIMTFGAMALLFAVPLASVGAYELTRFVSNMINFRLQPFRPIPGAIAIQIGLGLLLPPLAGLAPVLRGSQTTVRHALSSTGLGDVEKRKSRFDRLLERVRGISRPLLISLRNTFRRKKRLALTLFTLTLGGAVFIGVFSAQVSLDTTVQATTRYFGADVTLDFTQAYRIEKVITELMTIPGVSDVEVWAMTGGNLHREDGTPADSVGIIAPPADSQLVEPLMIEGRWILPGDGKAITVNEAIWEKYPDLHAGDTLHLEVAGHEDDWTVVGIFQYFGGTDLVAYANYSTIAGMLKKPYHASSYRIVTDQHTLAYQEEVSSHVTKHFRDLGYRVQKVEAGKTLTESIPRLLGAVTGVLLVMALMTALVGSIGLTGTMGMNVMERTREIGVMRAIGAHNPIIAKLVIVEGLIIGLISYVIGSLLSFPIGMALSNVISIAIFSTPAQRAFTAQGFIIWLVVVTFLSVLASLVPARNAARLTIREVLAYE